MSVLVYTENWDGRFKKLSFELVSYASELARMLNTSAVALSIGNVGPVELALLGKYGVKKIISAANVTFGFSITRFIRRLLLMSPDGKKQR